MTKVPKKFECTLYKEGCGVYHPHLAFLSHPYGKSMPKDKKDKIISSQS